MMENRGNFRSRPLKQFAFYKERKRLASIFLLAFLALFASRAVYLAVSDVEEFARQATRNTVSQRRLFAPRGLILDQEGRILADNRRSFTVLYTSYGTGVSRVERSLEDYLRQFPHSESDRTPRDLATDPRARRERIRLRRDLAIEATIPLLETPHLYPGLSLVPDDVRVYPFGESLAHLLGYLGPIAAGEAERFPRDRYRADDFVGRSGLEALFEDRLTGFPGVEELRRDARGRPLSEPEMLTDARPGADLHLTINAAWQEAAHQLLGRATGTLIVMDAQTGALRVLVSNPAYDPTRPGATEINGEPRSQFHRAVRGLYPPGSTIKPFSALAGWRVAFGDDERVTCTGSYRIPGWLQPIHCNVRTGHGIVNLREAIKVSCNVYFYEMAGKTGTSGIASACELFGFAEASAPDIPAEATGQAVAVGRDSLGEAVNISIGQGTFLATPLQVARAYAALATGRLPTPHVVDHFTWADGTVEHSDAPRRSRAVTIPAELRRVLLDGLDDAVNDPRGTAHKARFPREFHVLGKTGTAEIGGGHTDAWFAGFYPRENPRHVIVAHLERANAHGGEVAAPLARDLLMIIEGDLSVAENPTWETALDLINAQPGDFIPDP